MFGHKKKLAQKKYDDNGDVYCSCDTHKEAADEIAEAENN